MATTHEFRNADERVFVIGMGVMSPTPNGETVDGFWDDVTNGRHGFRPMPEIVGPYGGDLESTVAATLPPFDLKELLLRHGFTIGDDKQLRRDVKMSHKTAQGVVYAGAQALRQATLLSNDSLSIDTHVLNPEHLGVFQGTGLGGSLRVMDVMEMLDDRAGVHDAKLMRAIEVMTEQLAGHVDQDITENLRLDLLELATGASRKHAEFAYSLLELLPGRVDELATRVFNAKGWNDTYETECAASLSAVNEAVKQIRDGDILAALAGGVEMAAHPATMWAFEQLKAVDTSNPTFPRPFDESRQGLGFGEGVAEVVLARGDYIERLQRMGREITVFAEVLGTGGSSEAYHDSRPSDDGSSRAMEAALADAGWEAEELYDTLIEAHEPGTDGAIMEMNMIRSKFKPEQLVGIVSIKGWTGHTFGSAGGFGFIAAAKSLTTKIIHPNRNLVNPIPETEGYPMVPNKAKTVEDIRFAIVNSFGFGGKNRIAILGKFLGLDQPARASRKKRITLESYER